MSGEERLQGKIMEGAWEKLQRSLGGPGLVNGETFHRSRGGIGFRKGSHTVISIFVIVGRRKNTFHHLLPHYAKLHKSN
jgi:hypothetical protein